MACKALFYLKATALLLTLAVSSLVSCGGSSFSAADLSDSGVTPDVTGGQSSVISSQSSVRTSTGGNSSVGSATAGQSSATGGQLSNTGGSGSAIVYNATYFGGTYNGGSILPGISVGTCPASLAVINCTCILGGSNSFAGFSTACSENALSDCITLSKNDSSCSGLTCHGYTYFWECDVKSSVIAGSGGSPTIATTGGGAAIATTGGGAAIAATGGSAVIDATGGASSISPSTYTVTYLNQVASQSAQPPGTCPSGQSVTSCTCVISGMAGSLTSCNPTACQSENSKQYPQSTFTWSCV